METLSVETTRFSFTPRQINLSKGYPFLVDETALFVFSPGSANLRYSGQALLQVQARLFSFLPREVEFRWGTYNLQISAKRFRFIPRSVEFSILEGHKLSVTTRLFQFHPGQAALSTRQAHPLTKPPRIYIRVM